MLKNKLRKYSVDCHRWLAWAGAAILLSYVLSGITHPLMSWTGPKAATFFPPKAEITADHLQAIPEIVRQNKLRSAKVIKVIPAEGGPLLQITENNLADRRYFDLVSYQEKPAYDALHAAWLAKYYLGDDSVSIRNITKQTEFSKEYPWVNRLLPVYKVEFDTPDNKRMYIYTELNAIAGINNDWKQTLQTIFQWLHTWSFLDDVDNFRVLIQGCLLIALILFVLSGIGLVFTLSSRKITDPKRRWHRRIAYGIWFPLLGLSVSGFYHLLQSAYVDNKSGLKLQQTIVLQESSFDTGLENFSEYKSGQLNQVSIVVSPEHKMLYRLSVSSQNASMGEHHHHHGAGEDKTTTNKAIVKKEGATREARYKGIPHEAGAIYIDAITGRYVDYSDELLVKNIAAKYMAEPESAIKKASLVTHFSPKYDFRNKRLPVWMIDFDNQEQDTVFVDPVTGVIVDHTNALMRYERLSFSLLHKWNFLVPLIGRQNRDVVTVVILVFVSLMSVLGIIMLLKRRKPRQV